MFQKALHEDLEKKQEPKAPTMTLTQKHRITKKRGEPKTAHVLSDKKTIHSSSSNFLSAAQFSNRPQGQIDVVSYPNREVIKTYAAKEQKSTI